MGMNKKTSAYENFKGVIANAAQDSAAPVLLVAGGTGDGVEADGFTIDRLDFMSCEVSVQCFVTLGEDETLSIALEYQESDDGSTWDTAVAMDAATVVATGGSGGSTETGVLNSELGLYDKKRYIRFNVTPAFSAASTDTGSYSAACVLAGKDVLPAT